MDAHHITAGVADGVGRASVLDRGMVDHLGEELGSQQAALEICALFLKMLPGRVQTIADNLAAGKPEAARIAAMSLGTTAAMIGARRMERHAGHVSVSLRGGALAQAQDAAVHLVSEAVLLAGELKQLLEP